MVLVNFLLSIPKGKAEAKIAGELCAIDFHETTAHRPKKFVSNANA